MKIIQVNDTYSLIGGSEKTLRKCSEQLVGLGHGVIIAHGQEAEGGGRDVPWRDVCIPSLQTCTPLGDQSTCFNALRDLIQTEKPDIVHVRNFNGFRTTERLMSLVPTVRTVHTVWGYCPNGMKFDPKRGGLCRKRFGAHCLLRYGATGCAINQDGQTIAPVEWFTRMLACRMAVRADSHLAGVTVTSEYMRSELSACGVPRENISIIAPPIEITGTTEDCRPPTGRRVLFVGRVVVWKGLRALLDAFAMLPHDVELHIAGDGAHRGEMQAHAERLGIGERVIFHGWVPYEELGKLYRQCSAVAFPTVAPEPFGNVGPEAMVHGRPVVAFDVGGIREWLIDGMNGYIAPPGDIDAFAERLRVLVDDPVMAFSMGMAGRERTAKLFSAEEHGRRTVEFYERCIGRWKAGHRDG